MTASLIWPVAGAGAVLLLMLLAQSVWKPLKWVGYAVFKAALGGVFLFLFNSMAGYYDFTIPINPVTAAVSGILGIPGFASLIVIKAFILA